MLNPKWLLALCVFSLSMAASPAATPIAISFAQANQLYKAEQFSQALAQYQTLEKQVRTGPLYYNMGNCQYKLGHMIEAKFYFEKAMLYMPEDHDLQANLHLVSKQFQDKTESGEIQVLPAMYNWMMGLLSLRQILWGCLLLLSLGTFFMVLYRLHIGRAILQNLVPLYLLFIVLFVVMYWPRLRYFTHRDHALIFTDRVDVKSGPDDSLATLFILHQGAKVTLQRSSGAWYSISLDRNYSGWVPKSVLKVI